eukprot:3530485-Rhodomonas_salina.1
MFPSAKGRETLIDRTRIPADSYIIRNAFENLIRWDPMQCVKRLSRRLSRATAGQRQTKRLSALTPVKWIKCVLLIKYSQAAGVGADWEIRCGVGRQRQGRILDGVRKGQSRETSRSSSAENHMTK